VVDSEMGDLIVSRIAAAFPEDGTVCEDTAREDARRPGSSGRAWIIDPQDGTSDFSDGRRETAVSIALVEDGELLLGVVHLPCAALVPEPRLRAIIGGGPFTASWARGLPLAVERGAPVPQDTRVALLSQGVHGARWEENVRAVAPLEPVRCASMATRLALVATGAAEVGYTLRNPLAPWDFAGGQALLRGAGGELVDPHGEPVRWHGNEPVDSQDGYIGARSLDRAREIAKRLAFEVLKR
jgi:myo-inositol-1(or 4)-monophosphatase